MNHERSRELYGRALSVLAGGVNSSVRATKPYPFFIERGDGAHVVDADGNKYLDYVMGYGPLLYGHDLPEPVAAAIQSHAADGPMYGAPTEVEVELAEFVARHVPSVEMLRFVNSGTEATVSAVRLARGHTGRDKIVVMQGGYHGAQESTLVEGDAHNPQPSTAGIPEEFAQHTLPIPFNDPEAAEAVFEEHGDDIAAVLTEPILGNMGIVMPVDGFHDTLRELCDDHGSLLIFDEVITGFGRLGSSFAAEHFGVTPDIITLAKGLTNGTVPMGAVLTRKGIYDTVTGAAEAAGGTIELFHGYTYSGHPLACAAALASLEVYKEEGLFGNAAMLARHWEDALHALHGTAHVKDLRNLGIIAGIELEPRPGAPGKRGYEAFTRAWENGLLIRVTGDIIALSPPLILEERHIDRMMQTLKDTLESVD